MPELPEVETVVRDLRPLLTGTRIVGVRVGDKRLRKPWQQDWNRQLLQRQIAGVARRGKWIVLSLAEAGRLVIHLGMTGQLQVMDAGQPLESHTHLVFDLGPGRQLRFRDIRRFGSATWFDDAPALEQFFASSGLGPEPFDLDPAYWRRALEETSRNLKAVLLDQRMVAGVGNIYADESLFQARLHPGLRGRDLDAAAAGRLRRRGHRAEPGHRAGAAPAFAIMSAVRDSRESTRTSFASTDGTTSRVRAAGLPSCASGWPAARRTFALSAKKKIRKPKAESRNEFGFPVSDFGFRISGLSMSYRAFKRLLGETSLERKCRFLFGAFILLLITGSFWFYARQTEDVAYAQIVTTCRLLVNQIIDHDLATVCRPVQVSAQGAQEDRPTAR